MHCLFDFSPSILILLHRNMNKENYRRLITVFYWTRWPTCSHKHYFIYWLACFTSSTYTSFIKFEKQSCCHRCPRRNEKKSTSADMVQSSREVSVCDWSRCLQREMNSIHVLLYLKILLKPGRVEWQALFGLSTHTWHRKGSSVQRYGTVSISHIQLLDKAFKHLYDIHLSKVKEGVVLS
jgi:hypothetical protein